MKMKIQMKMQSVPTYRIVSQPANFHTMSNKSVHFCVQVSDANEMSVDSFWKIDAWVVLSIPVSCVIFGNEKCIGLINADFILLFEGFKLV